MRFRVRQPEEDQDKHCSICGGNSDLIEFEIDDRKGTFCLCYDCLNVICYACTEASIFVNPDKVKISPKVEKVGFESTSYKAGYREGYRDGFRDNYELHD